MKNYLKVIAFAALRLGRRNLAQAMYAVPLHQSDGMMTQVRSMRCGKGTS